MAIMIAREVVHILAVYPFILLMLNAQKTRRLSTTEINADEYRLLNGSITCFQIIDKFAIFQFMECEICFSK